MLAKNGLLREAGAKFSGGNARWWEWRQHDWNERISSHLRLDITKKTV